MNNYLVSPSGYALSMISGASLGLSLVLIQDKILCLFGRQTVGSDPTKKDILSYTVGFGMLTSGLYLLFPASIRNLWLR